MAVVFISPKKRQKVFFMGIVIGFSLFVLFFSLAVFLAQPKKVAQELVFNKPKITIDTTIFDSEQFKDLAFFEEIENQYQYTVYTDSINKTTTAFITGTSKEQVQLTLEEMGYTVVEIKETGTGRNNPFTPYYDVNAELNKQTPTKK